MTLKDVFPGQASKYHNKKITMDGQKFDSMKEAARYQELKLLEREVKYVADFTYVEKGRLTRTVEDVKGLKTDVYKIKRKLMLYRNGIRIKEI